MITYDGSPLLLEVAELQSWMDRNQCLADMRAIAAPLYHHNGRLDARSGNPYPIGLSRPNYPEPPAVKLNTLYWPTGATRWAFGFFLADVTTANQFLTASNNKDTRKLALDDGSTKIEADMYLLQPRPVTPQVGIGTRLILLPLVDERYWWQFRHANNLEITASKTWSDVYNDLSAAIGNITLNTDTPHADYLKPDFQELSRRYENSAAILEAVALSIGHRVIRKPDGTVSAYGWTRHKETHTANRSLPFTQIAGDDQDDPELISGIFPKQVVVTFPHWRDYRPFDLAPYIETINAPAATIDATYLSDNRIKTIHSTCFAKFATDGSGSPTNSSELNTLATRIATDYYESLLRNHDRTFNGLLDWEPCGYDDHIEWTLGRIHADGCYLASTRVQSTPYNFGIDEQLSQTIQVVAPQVLCKLETNWNIDSQTTNLAVWTGNPGSETDSGFKINAWNKFQNLTASIGSPMWVWCEHNGYGWYVTARRCT